MKQPNIFINHILDAINRIEKYTQGVSKTDFSSNELLQDGVIRQIEIIGEACSKLESDFKDSHTQIPWRVIIDTRNKFIHDYWELDTNHIWNIVSKDLPQLKQELNSILHDLSGPELAEGETEEAKG